MIIPITLDEYEMTIKRHQDALRQANEASSQNHRRFWEDRAEQLSKRADYIASKIKEPIK